MHTERSRFFEKTIIHNSGLYYFSAERTLRTSIAMITFYSSNYKIQNLFTAHN